MKREFLPFYVSRSVLSLGFAILVMGLNWKAIILATVLFGGFLLYLHSGWFRVDLRHPLMPLRRDQHGQEVQRRALIASIGVGLLIYLSSSSLAGLIGLPLPGDVALLSAIVTYFLTQFILFVRT